MVCHRFFAVFSSSLLFSTQWFGRYILQSSVNFWSSGSKNFPYSLNFRKIVVFNAIWRLNGILTDKATPGQIGPGSNGNEGVLHTIQSFETGASLSYVISQWMVGLLLCEGSNCHILSPIDKVRKRKQSNSRLNGIIQIVFCHQYSLTIDLYSWIVVYAVFFWLQT